jgi:hypothetical protein
MWPYPSTRFPAALQYSHDPVIKLEVWTPTSDGPVYSTDTPGNTLRIISGTVTLDKSQAQRSQLSVQLVDPTGTMVPKTNTDLLTPWGNEIRAYRGIRYSDGTVEYVLLGTFRISKNQITESQGVPTMSITGYDRSRNISRNVPFVYWPPSFPESIQKAILGKSFANLIRVICSDRWPPCQFDDTVERWEALQNDPPHEENGILVGGVVPDGTNFNGVGMQAFSEGTDMWAQARQYAQAVGCDLFFTRDGVCKFYRDPSFNAMSAHVTPIPVWSFVEGETAMFDQVTRTLDDSAAYNAVLVYGEGSTQAGTLTSTTGPVGTAWPVVDNDPTSPTYYGPGGGSDFSEGDNPLAQPAPSIGPYGSVPHIVTNNLLVSNTMVNDFAKLQLIIDLGSQTSCSIPSVAVNPAIEVDDIIEVQRQRLGLPPTLFIVSAHTIPLTPAQQGQLTLRQRRALT